MAITHQLQTVISDGALRISATSLETVEAATQLDVTVANAVTDGQHAFMVERTGMKSFFVSSDQDVTIKTNNSGAPIDTLTVKANKPIVWMDGIGIAPITADITSLFITNASGSAASIKILAGWDPTP